MTRSPRLARALSELEIQRQAALILATSLCRGRRLGPLRPTSHACSLPHSHCGPTAPISKFFLYKLPGAHLFPDSACPLQPHCNTATMTPGRRGRGGFERGARRGSTSTRGTSFRGNHTAARTTATNGTNTPETTTTTATPSGRGQSYDRGQRGGTFRGGARGNTRARGGHMYEFPPC
jgi:hypothetical protein